MSLEEDYLSEDYAWNYYEGIKSVRSKPHRPTPIQLIGTGGFFENSQTGKYCPLKAAITTVTQAAQMAAQYVTEPLYDHCWRPKIENSHQNWFAQMYWKNTWK